MCILYIEIFNISWNITKFKPPSPSENTVLKMTPQKKTNKKTARQNELRYKLENQRTRLLFFANLGAK